MKRKSIIYTVILMLVLSVTVGFSAFVSEMSISNIVADIRVKKDIRITDVSLVSESSNDVVPNELNYDADSVLANVTFNSTSSYVTYKVTITNIGNAEMGIFQISGLPEGVSYEITDYDLKDKICDSDNNCNLGISKEINVKFFPSSDSGVSTLDLNAEFDFRTFHQITYTDITVDSTYPIEVIDGGDLNITFVEALERISINVNGTEINYYAQISSGQTVTISNITGEVEIKMNPLAAKLVSGDLNTIGSIVAIGDEKFYVFDNEDGNVKLLAMYNLLVGYSVDEDYNITALANATGVQDVSTINDSYPYVGVIDFSDTEGVYSGSDVEEYVNNYKSYLSSLRAEISSARLITYEELETLGCVDDGILSCTSAPSWVYSTTYWSGTDDGEGYVWGVFSSGEFSYTIFDYLYDMGVRPVIEISVDDIYVPPPVEIVSGNIDTVGSIVAIGNEKFYVIGQEDGNVKLLSMYNLHVGNRYDDENGLVVLTNPTGIQDSSAIGWFDEGGYSVDNPIIGTVAFSNDAYWADAVSEYPAYVYSDDSTAYSYVENYKNYLEGLGITIKDARLISYEELITLGCNEDDWNCSSAPDWVYATSYWSGTADDECVRSVDTDASFGCIDYYIEHGLGVRPVIEIPISEF